MSKFDRSADPSFYSRQVSEARRFFITAAERSAASLVAGAGFERVQRDYMVQRQRFSLCAIEFVVGGRGTTWLAGRAFALHAGVVFVYDGRTPHKIVTDPQKPLEKYFIDLHPTPGRTLLRRAKLPADQAWSIPEPSSTQRLFDELLYHGLTSLQTRQGICDALLRAILLATRAPVHPIPAGAALAFQTYQRCCRTIDTHAAELKSLSEVASACALDGAYICRLFQRFDRQTPYQRLQRRRMDLAAARLCGGDVTIKQLARDMDYTDQFNFSRSFRSVFGVSPAQFRATHARTQAQP